MALPSSVNRRFMRRKPVRRGEPYREPLCTTTAVSRDARLALSLPKQAMDRRNDARAALKASDRVADE